jgi:hypothetical protein
MKSDGKKEKQRKIKEQWRKEVYEMSKSNKVRKPGSDFCERKEKKQRGIKYQN